MDDMVREYLSGSDIVYGVRSSRESDSFFKRTTARGFYRFIRLLGAEVVYDHADYRLLSKRVLDELAGYREANIFLRGMIPLIGFRSSCVAYERKKRAAGKSHYPLVKMLSLAFDGITSLSTKPLRLITGLGIAVALLSFAGIIWSFVRYFSGIALLSVFSIYNSPIRILRVIIYMKRLSALLQFITDCPFQGFVNFI